MPERKPSDDHFVTRADLKDALEKLPTRWEVRTLILAAVIANQFVPVADVAKALPWP